MADTLKSPPKLSPQSGGPRGALQPILISASERRDFIRNKALEGVRALFPLESSKFKLNVEGVEVSPRDYSSAEQKQAKLEGKSLTEPITGSLVLTDKDGKVVQKTKPQILLHLPWFTERHTFLVDGNEYAVPHQVRLRPGVYARRRGNDELEAQFNLVKKGGNFSLTMDPETGHMHLKTGSTHIPLYPVLRALGVPHSDIAQEWGADLADVNKTKFGKKEDQAVQKLYEKFTPEYYQTAVTPEARLAAVREHFNTAKMDPEIVQKTLGLSHETVQPSTMLKASGKLLNIFKKGVDTDDRENLAFKKLHSVDDFIKEKLMLSGRELRRKIVGKLDHGGPEPELKSVVPTGLFTPAVKSFLTTSNISSIPTQYNPLEVIDTSVRITPLGEGGISSDRAIPMETRQVHPSHLGIIDPVRTPEGGNTGADVRAAIHTVRDENGSLYAPMKDAKTGEFKYVPAGELTSTTIAFPNQEMKGKVDALVHGELKSVDAKEVRYVMPHPASMYSPSTNLVPLMENMQGNRTLMAAKMLTQALSLKDNEAPLVQTKSYQGNKSMEETFGEMTLPIAPVAGTIEKVDKDYIYIRPHAEKKAIHVVLEDGVPQIAGAGSALKKLKEIFTKEVESKPEEKKEEAAPTPEAAKTAAASKEDGLVKVKYDDMFPLATKTYLHNDVKVKKGDVVEKGQALADSNWTKDGALALGKNLTVGFMAYKGLNSNDAFVISESAAKKLTSRHLYREDIDLSDVVPGREKHRTYFGNKFTAAQYNKLDEDGCVKKGETVDPQDILFATVQKSELTAEAAMLGRLHKSLVKPYRDASHLWTHQFPGKIIDVVKTPKLWAITVLTEEPMQVGDKACGKAGNKGIISAIVPDDKMVRSASGKPLDMLMTSAGIVSRINPAQVIEMAVGKVAQKIGKPIMTPAFSGKNNVQWAKDLLKEHGLVDKETVFDPVSGKHIPGIMVGPMHILKLMKTTDTNYSARGVGAYDINEQPMKGGSEGAKGLSRMEVAALLGHGARAVLRENSILKSQKNDNYWKAVRLGLPPPSTPTSFAFNKFNAMLTGAGIRMDKNKGAFTLAPLTDTYVKSISSGKIDKPVFVRAKDLKPEEGGLFDPAITGGTSGTKFSHIELAEPIVSPVFRDPVRRLLGLTGPALDKLVADKGAAHVKKLVDGIDLDSKRKELLAETKRAKGASLDDAVKQIKYIDGLQKTGLSPGEAYFLSAIPVIPPVMRQITPSANGTLQVSDANHLYRDLMLASEKLDIAKKELTPDYVQKARMHLHDAVSAVFGLSEPVSPQNKGRGVKGFLQVLAGTSSPKYGYIQRKLVRRQLDLSGRGTVAPDVSLGMDEIGLPEDMVWTTMSPFIVGRLVRRGYDATQAQKMVEDRSPVAREEMLKETQSRPVMYNRAPTLHRGNILGAYVKPIEGQTIRTPATWPEEMMGMDFDGDQQNATVYAYVPDILAIDLNLRSEEPWWEYRKAPAEMAHKFKTSIPYLDGNNLYTIRLDEFPHLGTPIIKNNIEFYKVPPGIKVITYDEDSQNFSLKPVTGWSVHRGLEVEIVTLRSGKQIVTDDDERGVYGLTRDLDVVRRRPSNAEGLFVPVAHDIESLSMPEITEIDGADNNRSRGDASPYHKKIALDSNFGWLCGAMAGDGWVSHAIGRTIKDINMAASDDGVMAKFKEVLSTIVDGPTTFTVSDRMGGDFGPAVYSRRITVARPAIGALLEPLIGSGAQNKHIPPFFLRAPREFRLGLLAGLMDTDGSISISYAKQKPQWMHNFSTTSLRLAQEMVYLCKSLGIGASITVSTTPKGAPFWYVNLSSVDIHTLGRVPCEHTIKKARLDQFFKEPPPQGGTSLGMDIVPIPTWFTEVIEMGTTHSLYTTWRGAYKAGYITRHSANKLRLFIAPEKLKEARVKKWLAILEKETVRWDLVKSYEKTGIKETGYDLTVPGHETFMTVDGIVLSNTLQIHVPATKEAINDVKKMTLSNLIQADKVKGRLFVAPKMEAAIGLYKATVADPDPNKKPYKFKNADEALAAYRRGEVKLDDVVEVSE